MAHGRTKAEKKRARAEALAASLTEIFAREPENLRDLLTGLLTALPESELARQEADNLARQE